MTTLTASAVSGPSTLQSVRAAYQPKLPAVLRSGAFHFVEDSDARVTTDEEIRKLFPHSWNKRPVRLVAGDDGLSQEPLTVGVVLSGGPAPGGHNCIAGLLDALRAANPASRLIGFLDGPKGVIEGNAIELTPEVVAPYRNTGGFDIIRSGRDKIESAEDLARSTESLKRLGCNALVVIGGDDSNTNAAVLAEHLLAVDAGVQVIGLPKTIDGDMKSDLIEASFGFDTAAKTFAELVGNVSRDCISARKYYHFVKLMGRTASHVALEVALQTRPNLTIISEEVEARQQTLSEVVEQIIEVILRRAAEGKNYGVIVIPEGLLEYLADFKTLLAELNNLLRTEERVINSLHSDEDLRQFLSNKLTAESGKVYNSLPDSIQQVLLKRDKHGNIPVSQIETEHLLIDLVQLRLQEMKKMGDYTGSFNAIPHFFGYEGRCVAPSNFDANYCYTLGYSAAQLIRAGLTGYTVFVQGLTRPADQWVPGGVPVASMLNIEIRKGKPKPVIKKALVDLEGAPFRTFAELRESWAIEDAFRFPGPVQYFGPSEVADALTISLRLEGESKY